jgi:hypothetical protein
MEEVPGKIEFIERIISSRQKLDNVVGKFTPLFMTAPGASGDWSVKDILAHVTWHEQEMFNLILNRTLAGSDLWNVSLELRNRTIYEENRERDLKDVLDDYKIVFEGLMDVMQTLTDADLQDASHFKGMPSAWKPWEIIAQNTYEHYDDHLADLTAWLEKSKQS